MLALLGAIVVLAAVAEVVRPPDVRDAGVWGWTFIAIVVVSLLAATLVTEGYDDGLLVGFHPLRRGRRFVPWNEVARAEAVTYRALAEYGGRGWRISLTGNALTVSGNTGILVSFIGKPRTLLIGSRRHEELLAACHEAMLHGSRAPGTTTRAG